LEEEIKALPNVEERLKGFTATSGSGADAINQAHIEKALRDREQRAVNNMAAFLAEQRATIINLIGGIGQEINIQFTPDILSGKNKELLDKAMQDLLACSKDVDANLKKAKERLDREADVLTGNATKILSVHSSQELAFRALIEKHQAAMGQATERAKFEKLRNDLKAKERELADAKLKMKNLLTERQELIRQLSDFRRSRFDVRKKVVGQINTALSPNIKIDIVQDGNPEGYFDLVREALQGSKMKFSAVADSIINAMWPSELVAIVRAGDFQKLSKKAEISIEQAEKTIAALNASGRLFEIETVELIDKTKIELKDGENYKESQSLSTGQKCTTILPILLLESEKPLLVDQPEDNLDNRFISETVVKNIRSVKAKRQIIFITHNPNIPVLGDAERVFVMDSNGVSAKLQKKGNVDDCKKEIVTLLEGGEEAFKQRKKRYNY
jgi:hypothetical protein